MLSPRRTIDELKELRALTADADGAQRVAFTPTWAKARAWFREKLAALPVEVHQDAAGNLWATLAGASPDTLLIGGHLDSVPNGGWLDGCLNVLAGLEILRRLAAEAAAGNPPPLTVRLVDWADEEGARFGRSLFGSSACAGSLDLTEARALRDREGTTLADALRPHGIDLEQALESGRELEFARAYLELHIEQGPVLEGLGLLDRCVVLGTFGVERHAITFTRPSGPLGLDADEPSAGTRFARRLPPDHARKCIRELAVRARRRRDHWIGRVTTEPGIVTSRRRARPR